jgi:CubicO group peptidase (beta-lactamase class C family)
MPMAHLTAGLLAAATISLASAQGLAAGSPRDDAIGRVIGALVKPREPGCTVGVVEGGVLTHALAFGMSDLAQGRALDTHAAFNLASVSKQFTALALLLLEQQGKLKLDDPLVKYVPELAPGAQGVTLRHLMHHTGGLRDYIELLTMKGRGTDDGATIHEAV